MLSHQNNHVFITLGAEGATVKGLPMNPGTLSAEIQNVQRPLRRHRAVLASYRLLLRRSRLKEHADAGRATVGAATTAYLDHAGGSTGG
jgi:hypothetical protein